MNINWQCSRAMAGSCVPSMEANTLAVLSVLPAIIYSPVGLHAKSYTCIVVQLFGVFNVGGEDDDE